MKIEAFKCMDTGKLFEFEAEYRAHRTRYLRAQAKTRAKEQARAAAVAEVAALKAEVTEVEQLPGWLLRNYAKLMKASKTIRALPAGKLAEHPPEILSMQLIFSDLVSNSHSAPKSGVTNWYRDKALPLGYPGFRGQVSWRDNKRWSDHHRARTEMLDLIGVHTGTGGGGTYECRIYIDDWPGLQQELLFKSLIGQDKQWIYVRATLNEVAHT